MAASSVSWLVLQISIMWIASSTKKAVLWRPGYVGLVNTLVKVGRHVTVPHGLTFANNYEEMAGISPSIKSISH